MSTPPSHSHFSTTVRDAFSFLGRFGFREIASPPYRARDPFQIWFGVGGRFVLVAGEGHGTTASVTLEHDGRELPTVYLVPVGDRPLSRKKPLDQIEQLRELATQLERHGLDFLEGDLSRFNAKAKPLPPYKRPPFPPFSGGQAGR